MTSPIANAVAAMEKITAMLEEIKQRKDALAQHNKDEQEFIEELEAEVSLASTLVEPMQQLIGYMNEQTNSDESRFRDFAKKLCHEMGFEEDVFNECARSSGLPDCPKKDESIAA